MAQNDFLVWSGGLNANVLSQANYAGATNLTSGVVAGKASAQQANKTWRQTSIMSAMLAKFIVDRVNADVIDDGSINTIETNFINAITSLFVIPNTGVQPGTYGPTISITVQADGRVTGLSNTGLGNTGVTAGNYVAPTLGIGSDGRITSAQSGAYGALAGNNAWTGSNTFSTNNVNFTLDAKGNVNGAVMTFVGNGTVTPNKYIRVVNGVMQWLNSTFGAAIATLTDAGTFTASGRLRAGIGAFGSGDTAAATVLADFANGANFIDALTNVGWVRLPSGQVMQWGRGTTISGDQDVVNLAVAYTTGAWDVVACEGNVGGWGVPPNPNWTIFGVAVISASQFSISVARSANGAEATYFAGINYSYIAIGI